MAKRVLVTGASGFVGANLTRRLLQEGYDVHLLVSNSRVGWRLTDVMPHVTGHVADLRDEAAVVRAVARVRPEWVFHLAAHGAYSWQTDTRAIFEINVLGTIHLVGACLKTGFGVFINTGSSSEYGWKNHAPAEDEWLEPNSNYAVAKASATLFCRQTARVAKVSIPTLRLYNIYGPFEEPNRFLPALVVHGINGHYPPLVNPNIARDYVSIEDTVDAYLRLANTPLLDPGAVYNLGSGIQTSIRQAVDVAATLFDYKDQPVWGSMPNRHWDTSVWVANSQAVKRDLGWDIKVSLAQGLREFRNWLIASPELLELYQTALKPRKAC